MERIEVVACTDGTFDIVSGGNIVGNASGVGMALRLVRMLRKGGTVPARARVWIIVGDRQFEERVVV